MRKMLRGLAVATAFTLAPVSAALAGAPAQASSATTVVAAPVAAPAAKALPSRTINVKDLRGNDARLRITVKPDFGRKFLKIQVFRNGKFRKAGRIKTNKRGVAVHVFEGTRKGTRYRLIAPGGTRYAASGVAFTITKRSF